MPTSTTLPLDRTACLTNGHAHTMLTIGGASYWGCAVCQKCEAIDHDTKQALEQQPDQATLQNALATISNWLFSQKFKELERSYHLYRPRGSA